MRAPRQLTPDYSFDPRAMRYRDVGSGRFVAWSSVRQQLDVVLDDSTSRLQKLSERLVSGELSTTDWMRAMAAEMKQTHILSSVAARGGFEQMTPADWGRVGGRLRSEYEYLRRFAEQIERGEVKLDGRVVVRAGMYAQAARSDYEEIRRLTSGAREERRLLHARESCPDCIEYAARGWQPIGTLPPIGDSQCGVNCRCTFELR